MSDLHDTEAVILAGGKGTRLQSVVADRPKVLAEINGRPFIFYQLDSLASAGVRRVVLCVGYMAGLVREAVGQRYADMEIAYSQEDEPLDTAGAVRLAVPSIGSDLVLVMNGDSLFKVDLGKFYSMHNKAGATGSLMLVEMDDCRRYGTVCTDDSGRVTRFQEKSDRSEPGSISAGIYLLSKQILLSIPTGRRVSFEREVFPGWVGHGLCGFVGKGAFIDIGTPDSYALASSLFAAS